MASGHYPIDRRTALGQRLEKVRVELTAILASEGEDRYANIPGCLPDCADNTPEDAASDGGYRERLRLAAKFVEECLDPTPI